jgi:hypothetical protein
VERTFQTYSPGLASIEVKRRGDVRRSKLYYLRGLTGKAARIREKLTSNVEAEVLPEEAQPEGDAGPAAPKAKKPAKAKKQRVDKEAKRRGG